MYLTILLELQLTNKIFLFKNSLFIRISITLIALSKAKLISWCRGEKKLVLLILDIAFFEKFKIYVRGDSKQYNLPGIKGYMH